MMSIKNNIYVLILTIISLFSCTKYNYNCQVFNNTINMSCVSHSCAGITLKFNAQYCSIKNNTLLSSDYGEGIYLREGINIHNTISNNKIDIVNGIGIALYYGNESYNVFENNTITTSGNNARHAIIISAFDASYNNFTNNRLTTTGSTSDGIVISGTVNDYNRFIENIINVNESLANTYSIYLLNASDNTFINNICKLSV